MKRFSAQYIITGTGEVLKRGVISCDDSGKILDVSDTSGNLTETAATPFYNGIIVPGFVNCHTHIELSDMKGMVERGKGLGSFIGEVREKRNPSKEDALKAVMDADRDLYRLGTSAVADICNTSLSFGIKDKSPVSYINFLEVFGIDPSGATRREEEIIALKSVADTYKTPSFIVPHSVYSVSETLFSKLSVMIGDNAITSIHFLESPQERQLIDKLEGDLRESYLRMGISEEAIKQRVPGHLYAINKYLPQGGSLILVHNTFADSNIISEIQKRPEVYWCLCPNSNLYIENSLPPVEELMKNSATIVLGTDSLASNDSLNLLDELITLQKHFPSLELPEMIIWASRNGAEALNMTELGTIERGKTPGLVLLENCDLGRLKLSDQSRSVRLI